MNKWQIHFAQAVKGFLFAGIIVVMLAGVYTAYIAGYQTGVSKAKLNYDAQIAALASKVSSSIPDEKVDEPAPQPVKVQPKVERPSPVAWGGPELWSAVNKRRVEFGVNPLNNTGDLCTIASIRLNELLELGKLDGHEGFSTLPERRPDLKHIFEKYSISEFLVSGADSPEHAVSLWENTLGHKKLLTGGEYVWGCIYAQNSFGVAITAY